MRNFPLPLLPLAAFTALTACAPAITTPVQVAPRPAVASPHATPPRPPAAYTPHRVFDVAAGAFIDFEAFAARAAAADVVFFGEQHGHGPAHRMQHALLEALARRGDATVSMEMFERDVAHVLAGYVDGTVTHETLLAHARPWPNYFPDYHLLVETARQQEWQVIGANVPRPLASLVAREGLGAVNALPADTRWQVAAQLQCPPDDYRERFFAEMRRHPSGPPDEPAEAEAARLQRYYESQCVKDETMAESIVGALARGAAHPVVHFTGAFHVDQGDGIPVRVRRRMPVDARVFTITSVQVPDLDDIDVAAHAGKAEYLLFTLSASAAR